jgi:hypothetical protein
VNVGCRLEQGVAHTHRLGLGHQHDLGVNLRMILKIRPNLFILGADHQDEIPDSVDHKRIHDPLDDRFSQNGGHCFGAIFGDWVEATASTGGENDSLHNPLISSINALRMLGFLELQ